MGLVIAYTVIRVCDGFGIWYVIKGIIF